MRFEVVRDDCRKFPNQEIHLPTKATSHSAGYDFYSNEEVSLYGQEHHLFYTDVKVKLKNDEFLMIIPRSSIGIKKHLMLMNSVAIIDSDYYNNPDNDGNIILALINYLSGTPVVDNEVEIKKGERIAQGIVMKYVTSTEDLTHPNKKIVDRVGGIGSTGK